MTRKVWGQLPRGVQQKVMLEYDFDDWFVKVSLLDDDDKKFWRFEVRADGTINDVDFGLLCLNAV